MNLQDVSSFALQQGAEVSDENGHLIITVNNRVLEVLLFEKLDTFGWVVLANGSHYGPYSGSYDVLTSEITVLAHGPADAEAAQEFAPINPLTGTPL